MVSRHPPSPSHPPFDLIFNSALDAYTKRTRQYLPAHPLLLRLQSCDSADGILALLREQIPTFRYSDDTFSKWLIPTVNVLHAFSAPLGEGVGLVFSPAKLIFAGIGVLFSAAKDVSSNQDKLLNLFNRIGYFFRRLEIYTEIPPTAAMMDIIVEIMVEVLSILAMATNELKRGQLKKYLKKLTGNMEIEDAVQKLDELTLEEARIASAELMKITHDVNGQVLRVDDRVTGVHENVQAISDDVQDVGKKVQDVEDKVQGVGGHLDQLNRNQLRYSLLQWLSPPDPTVNHNIARKIHHSGSAQWFFQGTIFKQWKSIGSVLWLHGQPGSGKSILCSSIIQDIIVLRDAGSASLAYFYFDFRDIDKQKLHNLLPSLLIQLSARSDPCCDILSRLYSAHDRGVTKPSDKAMVECLKEMLILETQSPTYIILDALDESPITPNVLSPREEVLRVVGELVALHLPNLHICITSRPELDIRAVLEPLTQHPVSLQDESGQVQDIIDYITSFVHSDRRVRRWREEDKDLVIKTLSEKADGMFRWVFCQLDALRHCFPASVRRILEELPESLDETYERILREIRKSNQELAHRLLQCLVAAVRPLRVEELAEVLAFEFKAIGTPKLNPDWRWEDQEEAVLSVCSSLIMVVNHGHSCVVQFSHFSVQEFLTSKRLAESSKDVSRYRVRLRPAHMTLAQACLGALLRLDDHIDEDSIKAFPLAPYAAEHWASHARFRSESSRVKGAMQCLFDADKPYFAAWLWIYNPDRSGRAFWPRPGRPDARPLYYAARLGFRDLVKHLLGTHPGDVNATGGWDGTALHAALSEGHVKVSSVLLEHGADINIQDIWEGTPLHHASKRGQLEIGRWLLDRGANADARNGSNWTPLHLAATYGRPEFARMLLEHGVTDVDARGDRGRSALHLATANGRLEVVRVLLEHGANIDARDEWDRTPFELESVEPRKHRQRQEILQLISEHAFFQLLSECEGTSLVGVRGRQQQQQQQQHGGRGEAGRELGA